LPCAIATAHGKDSNFVVCHVGSAHGKACATSPFLSPTFFAVGQDLHTAKLCHVPDILHTAKAGFADAWLSCVLCRVHIGLYRVHQAHGKLSGSRSETPTKKVQP